MNIFCLYISVSFLVHVNKAYFTFAMQFRLIEFYYMSPFIPVLQAISNGGCVTVYDRKMVLLRHIT